MSGVEVLLNGDRTTLEKGTTVRQLVQRMVGSEHGVAVSIDREVVPRSSWGDVELRSGALVEVLTAAAGG
jgi:sulfur carrier protein